MQNRRRREHFGTVIASMFLVASSGIFSAVAKMLELVLQMFQRLRCCLRMMDTRSLQVDESSTEYEMDFFQRTAL